MKNTLDRATIGFVLSAGFVNVLNAFLVIFKELTPSFKKTMADATGHHWITHGMIILGLFVILGFVFSGIIKPDCRVAEKLSQMILLSVVIGGGLITVFYLLH
ncbi:hypothetical protein [Syntrophus aciditrophicus]|uniref:Hypothetical membrane protein n=1 Tax=Syntrophus aciditrophicus (strain SB) TaxID=56780 RepID=Q2LQL7_SYNAS|nr:hypothetical protein [Syntrophus aciditrophicus]ABC76377.1 hypothetical membrane protein [Syntrophus aciditrophicus SB]